MTDRLKEIQEREELTDYYLENPGGAYHDIRFLLSHIAQLEAEREKLREAISKIVAETKQWCESGDGKWLDAVMNAAALSDEQEKA